MSQARRRWLTAGAIAVVVGFNLVVLRGELDSRLFPNDNAVHLPMVQWATDRLSQGNTPLDGWFPYFSFGVPQFHYYQSLPHVVAGIFGQWVGAATAHRLLGYLLLATWPFAVGAGVRLMGWSWRSAAVAGVVSPFVFSTPTYGYEQFSYTWQGWGVWSQAFAMWLLPLAWGLSWRAINMGRNLAPAAGVVGLTVVSHFITGYLALLSLPLLVVTRRARFLPRLTRGALVGVGGLIVSSYLLVPFLRDLPFTCRNVCVPQESFFRDSFGAPKVLGWLVRGELFDAGRFPTISLLALAGVVVCVTRVRHDARARAALGLFSLGLVLFIGRATFGAAIDLLPGAKEMLLHRFIFGVQLAGLVLAGVGGDWLIGRAMAVGHRMKVRHAGVALSGVVALALVVPLASQLARSDAQSARFIDNQAVAELLDGRDVDALIATIRTLPPGRTYAGLAGNWGKSYEVGDIPMYMRFPQSRIDSIGFTLRLLAITSDVETRFDETNQSHYAMFGIRYLLLPADRPPSVPARLVERQGRHTLWTVDGVGYFTVVDTVAPIEVDRVRFGEQLAPFLASDLPGRSKRPTLSLGDRKADRPTDTGVLVSSLPGAVVTEKAQPANGLFESTVTARRDAAVVLSATFHPDWRVTVDGIEVSPQFVAPGFVAVPVGAGRHDVVFEYGVFPFHLPLIGLAAVVLAGLAVGSRRRPLDSYAR